MADNPFAQFAEPPTQTNPFAKFKPAPAQPSYMPTTTFTQEMDRTLGAGRFRDTGDYRTPAREDQLRAQGAATARGTSNHSRGTPAAPGAHDIVPVGMSDQQAEARLRGAPGVRDVIAEGAAGGQGAHLHVDMDDMSGNPFAKYGLGGSSAPTSAPPPTTAVVRPPTRSQPTPPAAQPKPQNPFLRYLGQEFQTDIADPTHRVLEDIRRPIPKPARNLGEAANIIGQGNRDLGDIGALAGELAGGELFHGAVQRPAGALTAKLPAPPKDLNYNPRWGEQAVGRAVMALGPEESPETLSTEAALPKPDVDAAAARLTAARNRNVAQTAQGVDDMLYRLGGKATAAKIEALQHVRSLPPEVRDPAVQEQLTHAVEQRLRDPNAEIPEHLQAAEAARQPWAERQRVARNSIAQRLKARGMSDQEIEEFMPNSGYIPRRVVGKSPGIDPLQPQERNPLAWNAGKRSLARKTGSMFQRDQIALDFEDGTSRFEHRNPSNDEWRPGMQVRDPLTGKQATVRDATIQEIEGAGARDRGGQLLAYHKNALVNTIDEALKTERVDDNLDALDKITKGMKAQGLAHQDEWHFQDDRGLWVRARANTPRPDNFVELPNIPQLKGWSFDPRIADVLKDYYPGPGEPLDNVISKVNRMLNASLFITPFPHIKNVATMGFVGRGWDWLPTTGNYSRLFRSGREAIKEVATLGPKYREFLREGGGMQAGDEATRNFYQVLMDSAAQGISSNPKIGQAMGLNPVEIGKALYSASHKALWNVNDMVMLQRYLELTAKGMSKREAIAETEKWIANYRIPSQVLGQRAVAQAFKSGNWINFGRYEYGRFRAIGEMIKGLSSGDAAQRTDAAGKAAALGVAGLIIYPLMDQMTRFITGNKRAKVTRGGELGMVDAAMDPSKDWAAKMASIVTPAPATEEFMEQLYNRNLYTGQHIREPQSTALGQATQVGEHAADRFYPAQLGMDALRPGGAQQAAGRLVGVNLPPAGQQARQAKGKAYDRREARRHETRDPVERLIRGMQ